MTVETEMFAEADADQLSATELSRMSTLIGDLAGDAKEGKGFQDFDVSYDEATGVACWTNDYAEVSASSVSGASLFKTIHKSRDETGADLRSSTVAIVDSEARVTRSVVRNNGQVIEPEQTVQLNRKEYDRALEDIAGLKLLAGAEKSQQPARHLPAGWMWRLIRRR